MPAPSELDCESRVVVPRDLDSKVTVSRSTSRMMASECPRAEAIANMKSVSEDVLRSIAFRRDWMRHYGILRSLVRNPRSPVDVTLGLVMKLNARDVKQLAGDRNVPEAIRSTARREVARKEP